MPLTDAPYLYPHDLGHAFVPGLTAIDGGKMDGFNAMTYGDDLTGYTQFDRRRCPLLGVADRFTLADHFFTSMYGPRSPSTCTRWRRSPTGSSTTRPRSTHSGNYCDDPTEHTRRFPIEKLTKRTSTRSWISRTEFMKRSREHSTRSQRTGSQTRTCVNIPVLPDSSRRRDRLEVLRDAGHLDERDAGDQARAVRAYVEQGAGPRHDPDRPAERPPARRLVADPAGEGQSERTSRRSA